MATETTKTIRNGIHFLAGFTFSYWLIEKLSIKDFPEWQYYAFSIVGGLVFGLVCGFLWEGFMRMAFKEQDDTKDMMLTMYGGLIGGLLATFCKDLTFISTYMVIACILGMAVDIYRAFKKEK